MHSYNIYSHLHEKERQSFGPTIAWNSNNIAPYVKSFTFLWLLFDQLWNTKRWAKRKIPHTPPRSHTHTNTTHYTRLTMPPKSSPLNSLLFLELFHTPPFALPNKTQQKRSSLSLPLLSLSNYKNGVASFDLPQAQHYIPKSFHHFFLKLCTQ